MAGAIISDAWLNAFGQAASLFGRIRMNGMSRHTNELTVSIELSIDFKNVE